jgi:DNA polymerase (family 10)
METTLSKFFNITAETAEIDGTDTYMINFVKQTCTCPDFRFRRYAFPFSNPMDRHCRHLKQWFETIEPIRIRLLSQMSVSEEPATKSAKGRHDRLIVEKYAGRLRATFELFDFIEKYEFCGSYRRMQLTLGDLDVIIAIKPGTSIEPLFDYLASHGLRTLWRGPQKASFEIGGLQIDLRLIPIESWVFAMLHFTGSKQNNIEMRAKAKRMGFSLSEYGIKPMPAEDLYNEYSVYKFLGLPYKHPSER